MVDLCQACVTFGLIFDVNTMQNRKKLNQFGPRMCE